MATLHNITINGESLEELQLAHAGIHGMLGCSLATALIVLSFAEYGQNVGSVLWCLRKPWNTQHHIELGSLGIKSMEAMT